MTAVDAGRLDAPAPRLCERRRRRVLDFHVLHDAEADDGAAVSESDGLACASARTATSIRAASRCRTGASSPRCAAARPDQRVLDRDIRERRRRPHLGFLRGSTTGARRATLRNARRPYRLRLRLSPAAVRHPRAAQPDGGRTWGAESCCAMMAAAGTSAIRASSSTSGAALVVYYMNLKNDPIQLNGGVRHIARTLFSPD